MSSVFVGFLEFRGQLRAKRGDFHAGLRGTWLVASGIVVARIAAFVSAWLLVVLTALPFTAPFASCDLAALMTSVTPAPAGAIHQPGHVASIGEAASSSGSVSFLDEQEFKGAALVSDVVSFHGLTSRAPHGRASTPASAARLRLIVLRI